MKTSLKDGQHGRLSIPDRIGYCIIGLLIACVLSFLYMWGAIALF